MVTQQLTGSMGRVMDQLVSGARADRDGALNTLDAVDRQTKAASEQIATTVITVTPPEDPGSAVRDDRFDPEEDWSAAASGSGHTRAGSAAATSPAANGHARSHDDEDDDYPDTWLR